MDAAVSTAASDGAAAPEHPLLQQVLTRPQLPGQLTLHSTHLPQPLPVTVQEAVHPCPPPFPHEIGNSTWPGGQEQPPEQVEVVLQLSAVTGRGPIATNMRQALIAASV